MKQPGKEQMLHYINPKWMITETLVCDALQYCLSGLIYEQL